MATVQIIAEEISRMGGIPGSTLRTVSRRLGESGLIPRGGPGTKPHSATPLDCARMIIGAMSIADGISSTVARVDQQVSRVERLETAAKIHFATDDSSAAIEGAILVISPGSFLRQLESLIRRLGTDEKSQLLGVVAAVGLTTGANRTWGWVEPRSGVEFLHQSVSRLHHASVASQLVSSDGHASGVSRIIFSDGDIECNDFTREVRMTSEALGEIASLCRPGTQG